MDNRLGIWGDEKYCYPDYSERMEWWKTRAEEIIHFQRSFYGKEKCFSFADGSSLSQLKNYVNDTITIFGCSQEILTDHKPYIVMIKFNSDIGINIVIFPESGSLLKETGLGYHKNYYLYIKGQLKIYNGKYEIILNDKQQVWQE